MKVTLSGDGGQVIIRFGATADSLPEIDPEAKPTGHGGYYVYVHRDNNGQIFYVGKGRGDRAWSNDLHPAWHQYVQSRCGGQYTVQIVSYHETEDEALSVESDYISSYGPQLVNWQNSGRGFDYKAIDQYWAARKANQAFVAETRPLETPNPSLAVERYQEAMRRMYEYESLVLERGLVADLNRELGMEECRGDKKILDRLTLCLWREQRYRELIDSVNEFVKLYPRLWGPTMDAILKRRAKAESSLTTASSKQNVRRRLERP
jgi:hypothetical protein